jgi:hypothetical protein
MNAAGDGFFFFEVRKQRIEPRKRVVGQGVGVRVEVSRIVCRIRSRLVYGRCHIRLVFRLVRRFFLHQITPVERRARTQLNMNVSHVTASRLKRKMQIT